MNITVVFFLQPEVKIIADILNVVVILDYHK
jgi:hypothetical protein